MSAKNFVAAGVAGGVTDFLLGWLLYGIVFRDFFDEEMPNMLFIFLGCMTFGFLMSFILVRWAHTLTFMGGLRAGAALGILIGLMNNFFMNSGSEAVNYERFGVDVLISVVIGALVGGVVAAVNGAMSKRPA